MTLVSIVHVSGWKYAVFRFIYIVYGLRHRRAQFAHSLYVCLIAYPSSPPPSRQHSEHGGEPGTNRFTSQSPVSSPVDAPATDQRLNLPFPVSLNPTSQNHLPSVPLSQSAPVHQQHALPPQFKQTVSLPNLHGLAASQQQHQQQFPPPSTMIASDRYQRHDRYTYPAPPPPSERRMSEPSNHFSTRQYSAHTPSNFSLAATGYNPNSYQQQHPRSSRSIGSFSDVTAGTPTTTTSSSSLTVVSMSDVEWQEESKHTIRHPSDGDSYSPIQSTFQNGSGPSLANNGLHSPHNAAQVTSGYSNNTVTGGYSLEDLSQQYDGRPHSSGGSSHSPQYQPLPPLGTVPLSQPAPAHPAIGYGANGGNTGNGAVDSTSRTYSFVSLPGNTVRKRPRRRYDEIERLYACNFPGCTKAYGTLNHLNAHVNMQKHGQKRHPNGKFFYLLFFMLPFFATVRFLVSIYDATISVFYAYVLMSKLSPIPPHKFICFKVYASPFPSIKVHMLTSRFAFSRVEFKEMRKQWRKAKKEAEAAREVQETRSRELGDVMRRRRATEPNFDSYGGQAQSLSEHMGIHPSDLPVSGYPLSGPSAGSGLESSMGGYGHPHYVAPNAYAPHHRAPISPLQPDSPPPNVRGSMVTQLVLPSLSTNAGGYDALEGSAHGGHGGHSSIHGYGSHHVHSNTSSPAPQLNRLSQDSLLLTPLNSHGHGHGHGHAYGDYSSLPSLGR